MDTLIQELQKTIEALETLSDMPGTAGEKIDELLDQLFQQKIDLISSSLNISSQPYQQASHSMKQAAAKAVRTLQEPGRIGEMTKQVSEAITKLAKLLDSITPIN